MEIGMALLRCEEDDEDVFQPKKRQKWRVWFHSCLPSQNRRQRLQHQWLTGLPADWPCPSVAARGADGPEAAAAEAAAAEAAAAEAAAVEVL